MRPLEYYLTPEQETLFKTLHKMHKRYVSSFCKKNYILVRGEAPVMLVAHLDTVHHEPVREICKTGNGNILMSPQGIGGDDRCGVYALNAVYEQSKVKPWLLFTCDEEVGGLGAEQFCVQHRNKKLPKEIDELKLLIEIDRKGKNDAVYYDCDNPEFEKYITGKGFETQSGSFTDISSIAPELGIAAVNLSSGYYNAHTRYEYINRKHLNNTVQKVLEIVTETTAPDFPKYEYIERVRSFGKFGRYKKCDWYNDYYDYSIKGNFNDEDNSEPKLEDVPDEILDEYIALLDFYTEEELEDIREKYGNAAISMLCRSEFGDDYYGMFSCYDSDEE